MSIYTRLLGTETPLIRAHQFFALLQEHMLGKITAAQAAEIAGLSAPEMLEVGEIKAKILDITNANPAVQRANRIAKAAEMENVFLLAQDKVPGYNDPVTLRNRILE